jgi:hypothetical protein
VVVHTQRNATNRVDEVFDPSAQFGDTVVAPTWAIRVWADSERGGNVWNVWREFRSSMD